MIHNDTRQRGDNTALVQETDNAQKDSPSMIVQPETKGISFPSGFPMPFYISQKHGGLPLALKKSDFSPIEGHVWFMDKSYPVGFQVSNKCKIPQAEIIDPEDLEKIGEELDWIVRLDGQVCIGVLLSDVSNSVEANFPIPHYLLADGLFYPMAYDEDGVPLEGSVRHPHNPEVLVPVGLQVYEANSDDEEHENSKPLTGVVKMIDGRKSFGVPVHDTAGWSKHYISSNNKPALSTEPLRMPEVTVHRLNTQDSEPIIDDDMGLTAPIDQPESRQIEDSKDLLSKQDNLAAFTVPTNFGGNMESHAGDLRVNHNISQNVAHSASTNQVILSSTTGNAAQRFLVDQLIGSDTQAFATGHRRVATTGLYAEDPTRSHHLSRSTIGTTSQLLPVKSSLVSNHSNLNVSWKPTDLATTFTSGRTGFDLNEGKNTGTNHLNTTVGRSSLQPDPINLPRPIYKLNSQPFGVTSQLLDRRQPLQEYRPSAVMNAVSGVKDTYPTVQTFSLTPPKQFNVVASAPNPYFAQDEKTNLLNRSSAVPNPVASYNSIPRVISTTSYTNGGGDYSNMNGVTASSSHIPVQSPIYMRQPSSAARPQSSQLWPLESTYSMSSSNAAFVANSTNYTGMRVGETYKQPQKSNIVDSKATLSTIVTPPRLIGSNNPRESDQPVTYLAMRDAGSNDVRKMSTISYPSWSHERPSGNDYQSNLSSVSRESQPVQTSTLEPNANPPYVVYAPIASNPIAWNPPVANTEFPPKRASPLRPVPSPVVPLSEINGSRAPGAATTYGRFIGEPDYRMDSSMGEWSLYPRGRGMTADSGEWVFAEDEYADEYKDLNYPYEALDDVSTSNRLRHLPRTKSCSCTQAGDHASIIKSRSHRSKAKTSSSSSNLPWYCFCAPNTHKGKPSKQFRAPLRNES